MSKSVSSLCSSNVCPKRRPKSALRGFLGASWRLFVLFLGLGTDLGVPRAAQNAPSFLRDGALDPHAGPKRPPRVSKRLPRGSQETTRALLRAAKGCQDAPRDAPKDSPEALNSVKKAHEKLKKPFQELPWTGFCESSLRVTLEMTWPLTWTSNLLLPFISTLTRIFTLHRILGGASNVDSPLHAGRTSLDSRDSDLR